MIFNGIDGQTVEFKITNYQFPDMELGKFDDDWLLIYLNVKSKLGHWQTIDPSLTTIEIKELIDWFIKLSNDKKPKYNPIQFIEPNLSFVLLSYNENKYTIRLRFALESRPKSAKDNKDYFLDFEYNKTELKQIATDLASELKNYPERKRTS